MLVLGADTSSTTSGFALTKNKKVIELSIWKTDKKKSLHQNLADFQEHLGKFFPVDKVVIERVSVSQNLNTVRKLAYFEAAAMISAFRWGTDILQLTPSQARKAALGKGNLKKGQVYDIYSKQYDLLPFKKGGGDQSDALCLSFAGYEL